MATAQPNSATRPDATARPGRASADIDGLLRTTSPRGWWALATLAIIIAIALLWSIFAWIPQQVTFTATVNAERYTTQVTSPARGKLTFPTTNSSPDVTAGQVLGTVTTSEGKAIPVVAPVAGQLTGNYGQAGQVVEDGQLLARILSTPDLAQGIALTSYLPASSLHDLPIGSTVSVTIADPASGRSYTAPGMIAYVASTPSDRSIMTGTSLSDALVDDWLAAANGTAYAVGIGISGWNPSAAGFIPTGGQVATVMRTYDQVHPLSIIFGS